MPVKLMELPDEPTMIATADPKDYIMMFYGPPGTGKTTFVNDMGKKTFFISTDRGTRTLSARRKEVTTWAKVLRVIDSLEANITTLQYDVVCLDHVDDLCNMAEDHVCAELGVETLGDKSIGWGRGFKAFKNEIRRLVQRLLALNVGVVFICHEDIKTIKGRSLELDRTMPFLGKQAWSVIVPLADLIGYISVRALKIKGEVKEVHILDTVPKEEQYAKDRTKRRKPEEGQVELLNAARFIESFKQGNYSNAENRDTRKEGGRNRGSRAAR